MRVSVRRAVRKQFGRDTRNPLIGMGGRPSALGILRFGSVWARSGRSARSVPLKLVPGLRLTRTEPGSPSY